MIDTVVLKVSDTTFQISPAVYSRFSQSILPILDKNIKTGRFTRANYQPDKELSASGEYLPKFSVMKAVRDGGAFEIYAHIEFSAPKILFGNNFDELTDDDLTSVCEALSKRLKMMGINIHPLYLKFAPVSTIHYGKNIPFNDYTAASQIIRDLSKCDTTIRKQHDTRDFTNGGTALYVQTKKTGLVVYDKVQELQTTKTRKKGQFEEDNECQISLLGQFASRTPFEVVRLEARLRDRKAIKNAFGRCGIKVSDYRFRDLFSVEIARVLLLDVFAPFEADQNNLMHYQNSLENLVTALRVANPNLSPKDILVIIGSKALLKEIGYREIRAMLGATSGQWSRLKQTIGNVKLDVSKNNSIDTIKRHLEKFIPVKLSEYGFTKNGKGGKTYGKIAK